MEVNIYHFGIIKNPTNTSKIHETNEETTTNHTPFLGSMERPSVTSCDLLFSEGPPRQRFRSQLCHGNWSLQNACFPIGSGFTADLTQK